MTPGRRHKHLAERRKMLGFSQEKLAEDLGVDRTTVARWELGAAAPQPQIRPMLAQILELSPQELSTILSEGADTLVDSVSRSNKTTSFSSNESLDDLRYSEIATAKVEIPISFANPEPASDCFKREPIDDTYLARSRKRIGQLLQMEHAFGGERVAGLSLDIARSFEGKILSAGTRAGLESDAWAVAAELFEISGWFLVDAAKHNEVKKANRRAIRYCRLAGDRSMEMLVIQNMSMHAVEVGNHAEGLVLARSVLDRNLSPRLAALFHTREARALAIRGDREAKKIIKKAMAEFSDGARDYDPPWAWWVDEGQLRWHEGRIYGNLEEWSKAIEIFNDVLDASLRPSDVLHVGQEENYLGLATLAYAQAKVHAWEDLNTTMLRLVNGIDEIDSTRTRKRIIRLVGHLLGEDRIPGSTRELAQMLSIHPSLLR